MGVNFLILRAICNSKKANCITELTSLPPKAALYRGSKNGAKKVLLSEWSHELNENAKIIDGGTYSNTAVGVGGALRASDITFASSL